MFKLTLAPVLAFAATVGLFAIPGSASAEPSGKSVAVRYADLDLNTAAGQQQLERRIQRAARQVCAIDETNTGTRIRSRDATACYDQALRDVRSHLATAIDGNRKGG